MPDRPYACVPGGVRLNVRARPNASKSSIDGPVQRDDNTMALAIRVTAQPERGKANAAIATLLAKTLGLRKTDITCFAGKSTKSKVFHLAGDPESISAKIDKTLDRTIEE